MSNYKDDPRLSPGQNELARKLAEEGNATGEYTQSEKMALVAAEMMDPKEVGLTSAEDAQKQIMPEEAAKLQLGKGLRFECWIVPPEIRAEWAYTDTKIILAPTDKAEYIKKWLEDNKSTFLMQARLHCGNGHMEFEQMFKDEVLGLCAMTKTAGEKLEQLYLGNLAKENEVKEEPKNDPITDPSVA